MVPGRTLRMGTNTQNRNRQSSNRRSCTEGSCFEWDYDCRGLSQVSDYYKEIGDDLARRERMAQAMYDC